MARGPAERQLTLRDVAQRCGVGTSTVSYALRGDHHVSEAVRARILAVAAEMGYDPASQEAARRLVERRTRRRLATQVVALMFPPAFTHDPYFTDIFNGIIDELSLAENDVVLIRGAGPDGPMPASPSLRRGDVDGLIIAGPSNVEQIAALRALPYFGHRPIAFLGWPLPMCSNVLIDDEDGTYRAARHLLDLGHRYFLQFLAWGNVRERRLGGVIRALWEFGLDPARHLVVAQLDKPCWITADFPTARLTTVEMRAQGEAHRAMPGEFLAQHPEITAVIAWNDGTARHLWQLLTQAGRRIPDEISLVGFDDKFAILDEEGHNLLTTVRVPLEQQGREAARLLLAQVRADSVEPREIVLPVTLIERRSTGPAVRMG